MPMIPLALVMLRTIQTLRKRHVANRSMLSVVHDLDVSRATATLKFRRIFAVDDVVCHGFLPLKSHTANATKNTIMHAPR